MVTLVLFFLAGILLVQQMTVLPETIWLSVAVVVLGVFGEISVLAWVLFCGGIDVGSGICLAQGK